MTDELIEARFTTMESDIKEIKESVKNMAIIIYLI